MVRLFKQFATIAFLGASLTGLLTGCASVKLASTQEDAKAKTFATNPNQANLYIYRNEFMGAAIQMPIDLDGREIGKTGPKSYLSIGVAPGKHTLVSKAENDFTLDLATEAGKNYYVWQEVKMGLLYARTKLQLVDEAQGQAGVRESKLLEISGAITKQSGMSVASNAPSPAVTSTVTYPVTTPVASSNSSANPSAITAPISKPSPELIATNSVNDMASTPVKIEKVPFELGVSSVTVERIAKQNSCESKKGAGLLYRKSPVEVYRIECDDGREIKARCEMRQCEIFKP
ncbi:DUF2846 domain-containing protein [Undibacterium sp. Ji22W]|uniref:DUF2846 domain-containing protein n=1 Tax=Undibacterium sp. Ji22W TaxID=3413038 RepID=UPI003BF41D6A